MAVQALLVGASLGASPAPFTSDIPGHVLCLTDGSSPNDAGQPASDTSHAAQCCALRCGMFGPTVSAPPQISTIVTYPVETSVHAIAIEDDRTADIVVWTPQNARAPPHLI
jgi:hypothetical protein